MNNVVEFGAHRHYALRIRINAYSNKLESNMAAYVIVQERVDDQAMFEEYKSQVLPTFEPFGARFLVRGGAYTVLEGNWALDRTVIVEFPSRQQAEAWYHSEAYQKILPLRTNASQCNLIIIDGAG